MVKKDGRFEGTKRGDRRAVGAGLGRCMGLLLCVLMGFGGIFGGTAASALEGESGGEKIAAGGYHSLILRSDGTVWGFGSNAYGQLGDGFTQEALYPVQARGLGRVTAVAAGELHSVILQADGTVWTFGDNRYGQLGLGLVTVGYAPAKVPELDRVTAISAGRFHTAVLKADGTVWTFGNNTGGQLGNAAAGEVNPGLVKVLDMEGVTEISAGAFCTLMRKADGTVWITGTNEGGSLNTPAAQEARRARQVPGLENAAEIAAGAGFCMARTAEGAVYTWGENGYGQLGDGGNQTSKTPVRVPELDQVTEIYAGARHAMARTQSGELWSWGYNGRGQLGNGSTLGSRRPILGGLVSDALGLSTQNHTLWIKEDGSVWGFGDNQQGQLGIGTKDDWQTLTLDPCRVLGITGEGFFDCYGTDTVFRPQLNTRTHPPYLNGYKDGTVRPRGEISREEAAQILYSLMTEETKERYQETTNHFTDVITGHWSNPAISVLSAAGIINGYGDLSFRPRNPISRAELVTMICKFYQLSPHPPQFSDCIEHWARSAIEYAAGQGWVSGYPSGNFLPDQRVTRGEAVSILNKVTGRSRDLLPGITNPRQFSDNKDPTAWFYPEIQLASNQLP